MFQDVMGCFGYVEEFDKKPKKIRFIDSKYNEKFRIHSGMPIRLIYPDGRIKEVICLYIDDYHAVVGDRTWHICEFAEWTERNNIEVEAIA